MRWDRRHVRRTAWRTQCRPRYGAPDLALACSAPLYPWAHVVLALPCKGNEATARALVESALQHDFTMRDAALTASLPKDLAATIVTDWLRKQSSG